jgi:hypothetical protein
MQHTASHISTPQKEREREGEGGRGREGGREGEREREREKVLTCIQATDRRHTPGYTLLDQKKLRRLRSQYVPNKKTGPTQRKLVASQYNNTHKKQHFHYQQQKTKM